MLIFIRYPNLLVRVFQKPESSMNVWFIKKKIKGWTREMLSLTRVIQPI